MIHSEGKIPGLVYNQDRSKTINQVISHYKNKIIYCISILLMNQYHHLFWTSFSMLTISGCSNRQTTSVLQAANITPFSKPRP